MKKIILVLLMSVILLTGAFPVFSMTDAQRSALIEQILQQIAALQAQLNQIQKGPATQVQTQDVSSGWCHTFSTNLGFANSGSDDVEALHMALQKEGIYYGSDGPKEYGKETATAVVQFQVNYGISPASGFTGPITRGKLNALYGCPPLSFIYPNGGETLSVGDTVRITWNAFGLSDSDNVIISAYAPQSPYLNVKTLGRVSAKKQNYYDWKITQNSLPSISYPVNLRLKIEVVGKNISATSRGDFTVNSTSNQQANSIELTYPKGGQVLYVGDSVRITWKSQGLSSTDDVTLTVYDSANPNANIKTIAKSVSAIQGYYDWNIRESNLPSASYPLRLRVKVEVDNKNITSASTSDITVNSSDQESISLSLIVPNGGETFQGPSLDGKIQGDSVRITWTTKGLSSSDKVKIIIYMPSNPYVNVKTITSSVTATQGYYDWKISKSNLPSMASPVLLRAKLEVVNKNISTISESDFTVIIPASDSES